MFQAVPIYSSRPANQKCQWVVCIALGNLGVGVLMLSGLCWFYVANISYRSVLLGIIDYSRVCNGDPLEI